MRLCKKAPAGCITSCRGAVPHGAAAGSGQAAFFAVGIIARGSGGGNIGETFAAVPPSSVGAVGTPGMFGNVSRMALYPSGPFAA